MKLKKLLALLLAMVLCFSVAACSQSTSDTGTDTSTPSTDDTQNTEEDTSETADAPADSGVEPYLGITIFDYSNNFVGYIRNGIDYYIDELGGMEYLMVDGENNQATQTERIDTMISRGVNVLAVNPVDSSAGETIVAKAKEADIPVVFFNRMPPIEVLNSYDKCWYVGLDSVTEGALQADLLNEAWTNDQATWDVNGDGVLQYVLVMGTPGHSDAEDRANGFHDRLAELGTPVEELASEYANWSTADANEVVETWIGRYGNQIEMVVCSNDAMALGAVEALRSNGLITDTSIVPVMGVNALPEVSELISSGVMLGTVLTSPYDSARAIVDLCINAANGEEDVTAGTDWTLEDGKIVRIPETTITVDNVDVAVEHYKTAN